MRGPSADERSTRPSRASVGAHLTRGVYVDRLQGHLGRGVLDPKMDLRVGGEGRSVSERGQLFSRASSRGGAETEGKQVAARYSGTHLRLSAPLSFAIFLARAREPTRRDRSEPICAGSHGPF